MGRTRSRRGDGARALHETGRSAEGPAQWDVSQWTVCEDADQSDVRSTHRRSRSNDRMKDRRPRALPGHDAVPIPESIADIGGRRAQLAPHPRWSVMKSR